MRLIDSRPYLLVHLNGAGPYPLLLDTGAQGLFLPRRVVEPLGIPIHTNPGLLSGARRSKLTWLHWARLDEVRVGEARFTNVIAIVLDEVRAETGTISLSLFQDALVTLDYPSQRFSVSRGRLGPVDDRMTFAYRTVSDCPKVDCALQDKPVAMLLDTGFTHWVSLSERKARNLRFAVDPEPIGQGLSVNYRGPVSMGRLAGQLQLGRHRVDEPLAVLGFGERLGGKILEHFVVTFDTAQQRVRFLRDDSAPVRAPPLRSFGFWFERRSKVGVITSVVAGTPAAAAGIRVGDRLLALNGRAMDEVNTQEGELLLEQHASLRLTLQRAGGETVEIDLRLVDLIP